MKLKETAADLEVKEKLWCATDREIHRFSQAYSDAHEVGVPYSEAQKDTTSAAKRKGYPKGLIRSVGAIIRSDGWESEACADIRNKYRQRIGL